MHGRNARKQIFDLTEIKGTPVVDPSLDDASLVKFKMFAV